jgi:hypothetical protein
MLERWRAGVPKSFHAGGTIMIYKQTVLKASAGQDHGIQISKLGMNIIKMVKLLNNKFQSTLKQIFGLQRTSMTYPI